MHQKWTCPCIIVGYFHAKMSDLSVKLKSEIELCVFSMDGRIMANDDNSVEVYYIYTNKQPLSYYPTYLPTFLPLHHDYYFIFLACLSKWNGATSIFLATEERSSLSPFDYEFCTSRVSGFLQHRHRLAHPQPQPDPTPASPTHILYFQNRAFGGFWKQKRSFNIWSSCKGSISLSEKDSNQLNTFDPFIWSKSLFSQGNVRVFYNIQNIIEREKKVNNF